MITKTIPISEIKQILNKLPKFEYHESEYFHVRTSQKIPGLVVDGNSPIDVDVEDMAPVLTFRKNWRLREWELIIKD